MKFEFQSIQFHFEALERVVFPRGKCGNIVRGAFGRGMRAASCEAACLDTKHCALPCAYHRLFEPRVTAGDGPSGLSDPPRPFVIRAWNCDGRAYAPGERFWFDLHRFDATREPLDAYRRAFERFEEYGVGPGQAKARLVEIAVGELREIELSKAPAATAPIHRMTVEFLTPTEIKSGGHTVPKPEFGVLFARIRDRISTLRALYGDGPLEIAFCEMAEQASRVRSRDADIVRYAAQRRSGRTGQEHPIGGFTGGVTYESDEPLNQFIPYLEAARWTGVGRQTVWGNGEIVITGEARE